MRRRYARPTITQVARPHWLLCRAESLWRRQEAASARLLPWVCFRHAVIRLLRQARFTPATSPYLSCVIIYGPLIATSGWLPTPQMIFMTPSPIAGRVSQHECVAHAGHRIYKIKHAFSGAELCRRAPHFHRRPALAPRMTSHDVSRRRHSASRRVFT